MTSNDQGILSKLAKLDVRIVFASLFIVIILALELPLVLPLKVSSRTQGFFNEIDKLPEGSVVYFALDTNPAGLEQRYGARALWIQLMQKPGVKIVFTSILPDAPLLFSIFLSDPGTFGKIEGKDFVYLGYLPGTEASVTQMAKDVWGASGGKDWRGNSLEQAPMMANIHSAADFTIIVCDFSGDPFYYVRQWVLPYKVPLYAISPTSLFPLIVPYEPSQIKNILVGIRGAAEYDFLNANPGPALASMNAQSFAHILAIGVIVLGNVIYWGDRLGRKK